MTRHLTPGTYLVLDPHVRDTISTLLASAGTLLGQARPHSTTPLASQDPEVESLKALAADALSTAREARAAHTAQRARADELALQVEKWRQTVARRDVELSRAHETATTAADALSDLKAARDTLAATNSELLAQLADTNDPPAPERASDHLAAFEALASRMESQAAAAKSKDGAAVLRLAARAVREEIAAVTDTPKPTKRART